MREKDFSERLKNKLSDLEATETYREDDWTMLNQQLDKALPQQKKCRRLFLLPFLFLTTLAVSNLAWWHSYRRILADKEQATIQLKSMQTAASNQTSVSKTDTVWRTIYIEKTTGNNTKKDRKSDSNSPIFFQKMVNYNAKPIEKEPFSKNIETQKHEVPLSITTIKTELKQDKNIETLLLNNPIKSLNISQNLPNLPTNSQIPLITTEPKKPFLKRPNYQIGLRSELVSPLSKGLTPEIGLGFGLQGSVQFAKHWRIVGGIGMAYLNYTATDKNAILGSPEELPAVANSPNSLTQMHLNNQGCMRYDLNMRYIFNPIARLKPFVSVGTGGMFMRAYQMDLQVTNMQNMMIHQSNIQVSPMTHQQQMYRLSTGFELPLTPHWGLNIEGYFMRQWKKTVALAPDFIGFQTALYYNF